MIVIDAFIFYNELDMLEFRLMELYDVVDKFVIVESTHTFSGELKPLYYKENKEKYNKWNDKIIHLVYKGTNTKIDAWTREKNQRNYLRQGVDLLKPNNNDIIIISDADEIPDTKMIINLKKTGLNHALRPIQDMYYYNLTCKAKVGNSRCRIMNYNTFKEKTPENHTKTHYKTIEKGGWHFSYFGDTDFIINKIMKFSHQEYNKEEYLNKDLIKDKIKKCIDLFNRDNGIQGQGPHKFYYIDPYDNLYLPINWKYLLKFET